MLHSDIYVLMITKSLEPCQGELACHFQSETGEGHIRFIKCTLLIISIIVWATTNLAAFNRFLAFHIHFSWTDNC